MTSHAIQQQPVLAASLGIAAIGGLVLIAGAVVAPGAAAASYLVAYAAALPVILGMLLLLMIVPLSGGTWFAPFCRIGENVVDTLPVLAILAIPMLVAPGAFWAWARDDAQPYFGHAFFALRAVIYWTAWLVVAGVLRRLVRQRRDERDAAAAISRLGAVAIPVVAVTLTLASFDWMMSLSPEWSSSVYGAYVFAGGMVGALALVAVLRSSLAEPASRHLQALGQLTLAFVLFWGYLWYSQFFIIWIAGLPSEVPWYVARFSGGWRVLSMTLVIVAFVVPFLVLVLRAARESATVLTVTGAWLLTSHYVDVYWLVVPSIRPRWTWMDAILDIAAVLLVVGSATSMAIWRNRPQPHTHERGDIDWFWRFEAR